MLKAHPPVIDHHHTTTTPPPRASQFEAFSNNRYEGWSADMQQLLLTEREDPEEFNSPDLQQALCGFEGGACVYRFCQMWSELERAGNLEALRDGLSSSSGSS